MKPSRIQVLIATVALNANAIKSETKGITQARADTILLALDELENLIERTEPSDPLLTPQEVAERLGIARGTLEVWRSTGRYELPFVKVGRKVFYRQSDVETFLKKPNTGSS